MPKPGGTTARGYGSAHQRTRRTMAATFTPGQPCARCGKPIHSLDDADLGHDDHDRTRYRGMEHVKCNRGAGARTANKRQASWRRVTRLNSRRW